jgi:hypothetical protein
VLLIALAALCGGGKAILHDTLDPDCFWHLRVAEQLHREGVHPLVDHIAFGSSKTPWTPYSWLAELAMKAIWDAGDYRAAVAVQALMQAAMLVLMAMACVEMQRQPHADGGEPHYFNAAIATFIGGFLTLGFLSFRPVTATFVLLWLCTWLILRDRRFGERSLAVWLLVPLTALMTNIHLFAFFVPAVVLGMWIGALVERRQFIDFVPPSDRDRRARRYLLLLCAVSLAYLATPLLPGVLRTVLFYSGHDEMVSHRQIVEMQFFAKGGFGIAAAVIAALILGCLVWRWWRLRVGEWLCFVAGTVLLFKLARFQPIFAMAAVPAAAVVMPRVRDQVLSKRSAVIVMAIVLLAGVVHVGMSVPRRGQTLSMWLTRHGPDVPTYPCKAADYVEQHVTPATGRLIDEFSWGGYLGWRLGGQYQVLLDGRTQLYTAEFWHSLYLDCEDARRRYLAGVRADAAVLPLKKSSFHDALSALGWRSVYKDDQAEVLLPPLTAPATTMPAATTAVSAAHQ